MSSALRSIAAWYIFLSKPRLAGTMGSAFRNVAAVVAGFVVASIVMMTVEAVNGGIFYPELAKAAEGIKDREALRALIAGAPVGALLVVIVGWALGGLAGGWVTAKLSRGTKIPGFVLGVLLTLAGVANNLMIPPPVWFWFAGVLVLMPAAYAGARLAVRSTRPQR